MRPLEAAAHKLGVELLLEHRMTAIHREYPGAGRVTGIQAVHQGKVLGIRARKAVIIATGGHTGNVEFRRQFDPRLTAEYVASRVCRGPIRMPPVSSPRWP